MLINKVQMDHYQVIILQNEKKNPIQVSISAEKISLNKYSAHYKVKLSCVSCTHRVISGRRLNCPHMSDTNMLIFMCTQDMGPLSRNGMPPLNLTEKKENSQIKKKTVSNRGCYLSHNVAVVVAGKKGCKFSHE